MWRPRSIRASLWLTVFAATACACPAIANDHWAFQTLQQPEVPQVKDASRVRTDIDRFVLARLEERGLGLSADAEPHALVRRVYFDLVGLPPSPHEVAAFVNDPSTQAYERLIDR